MKLIFENWNKWLNEGAQPLDPTEAPLVKVIRDNIRKYYNENRQGGKDWQKWALENPEKFPSPNDARQSYILHLQKRIYDILDSIPVTVASSTSYTRKGPGESLEYGSITIAEEDKQNKHRIKSLFFQAIDQNISNTKFCKGERVCPTATELFADRITGALGGSQDFLGHGASPDVVEPRTDLAEAYRELRILRMRQGVNMQEMTPVDLKRIRQFGGKEGHLHYAPNLRAALIRMKKMGKPDDIILKNLNNIAMRQTKTDTRIA